MNGAINIFFIGSQIQFLYLLNVKSGSFFTVFQLNAQFSQLITNLIRGSKIFNISRIFT